MDFTFVKVVSSLVVLAILFVFEAVFRYILRMRRHTFEKALSSTEDVKTMESLSLEYNKYRQYIDVVRMICVGIAVLIWILLYDIQAFSFLIVGVGAIIIVMRDSVVSIFGYFYVMTRFDIGDDIRVGDTLGEIGKISPLVTFIIGKEEGGEYNGKLIHVPNFLFLQQKVEIQELKTTAYKRTVITYTLNRDLSSKPLSRAIPDLRDFLDDLLPLRSGDEIGHFRSYVGRRYRLSFDFNTDGFPMFKIAFVAHPDNIGELREKIFIYLDNLSDKKEVAKS